MRASYLFFFALFPLSFAVPIGVTKPAQRGLAGIAGAVVQSIENPALTKGAFVFISRMLWLPRIIPLNVMLMCWWRYAARLQVVKGLADTGIALKKVSAQASSTNNAGVTSLVSQAQSGLAAAKGGVSNIAASIISGATPSKAECVLLAKDAKARC
jgi:hypothetical protein